MRYRLRSYSLTTGICLILGVVSAFGFDWTGHLAWLVIGGCAAAVAISSYFAQHLQAKSGVELANPTSSQSTWWMYESLATKPRSRVVPVSVASYAMYSRGSSWKTKHWESAKDWGFASHHGASEPHSPAELALRIVRDLQVSGKREVQELVIAADSSITLRFKEVDEQQRSSRFPQATRLQSPEYIH